MEEEESNEDKHVYLRKKLKEMFGTFEEFYDKTQNSSQKHGVKATRGKLSPAFIVGSSPNHVPVTMVFQSMRNLAEEPLTNLPPELPSLRAAAAKNRYSTTPSSSTGAQAGPAGSATAAVPNEDQKMDFKKRKRKEMDENEEEMNGKMMNDGEKRKKSSRFDDVGTMRRSVGNGNDAGIPKIGDSSKREKDGSNAALSPDSGVHSTENDMCDDNQSIEDMLNIMTSLEKPKLSPVPDDWLMRLKQLEQNRKDEEERRKQEQQRKEEEEEEEMKRMMVEKKEDIKEEQEEKKSTSTEDRSKKNKKTKSHFSSAFNDESSSGASSTTSSPSPTSSSSPARSSVSPSPPQPPQPAPQLVPISSAQRKLVSTMINPSPSTSKTISLNGEIRLAGLKSSKVQKLLKIAKKNGCLIQQQPQEQQQEPKETKPERSDHRYERKETTSSEKERQQRKRETREEEEKESERRRRHQQQQQQDQKDQERRRNREKDQQLKDQDQKRSGSVASLRPPSGPQLLNRSSMTPRSIAPSAKNTPTTMATSSRPSSSMSANHELFANAISSTLSSVAMSGAVRSQNVTPRHERPDSSASSTNKTTTPPSVGSVASSSSTSPWKCSWKTSRLTTPKRLPIHDPTQPNQKTKKEFYHHMAKEYKSKADASKDRVYKILDYIVASVYFVMEAITLIDQDRSSQSRPVGYSIYKDSQELLRTVMVQAMRESDDSLVTHMLPRIKILGQKMLAIMNYQMYMLRSDQVLKYMFRIESSEMAEMIDTNVTSSTSTSSASGSGPVAPLTNKLLTQVGGSAGGGGGGGGSAGSTPRNGQSTAWLTTLLTSSASAGNEGTTQMPTAIWKIHKQQIRMMNGLVLAQRYWEDSKALSHKVDLEFLKNVETVCGKTLSIDSPFETIVPIVFTAVASLKMEYDEERKMSIRPLMGKVKPLLELALKTGQFFALPSSSHRVQNVSSTQK